MCSQTRNSCAKAFDNQSRSKNLKQKKLRGGINLTPLLKASGVKYEVHLVSFSILKLFQRNLNYFKWSNFLLKQGFLCKTSLNSDILWNSWLFSLHFATWKRSLKIAVHQPDVTHFHSKVWYAVLLPFLRFWMLQQFHFFSNLIKQFFL